MSIIQYGLRFVCDLDQTTADGETPPPGLVRWDEQPVPAGWVSLDLLTLQLRDFYGNAVAHLCPACAKLSIGDIAARLRELARERKANGR